MELTWRHKSAHLSTFRQQHLRQPAAPSTHSPTLTLSLVHLSLHSLTLKQREGGREGEEGKIGGYPSCRAPWIASKGRAPQGMGDRRGRSPLFLTTLELGRGEASKKKEPEELGVGSWFSITLRSFTATSSNLGEYESSSTPFLASHGHIHLETFTNDLELVCTQCSFNQLAR